MNLRFVPIPQTHEWQALWAQHWVPFLPAISKRSKEPIASLVDLVKRFEVQVALVWDGEKAHALVGIRRCRRGDEIIGEIIWLTGKGMKEWQSLLPQLEQFLKDTGCAVIRPVCRPGWSRLIKSKGYKTTHYVMEKKLA